MGRFVVRRLLWYLPLLLVSSFVVFVLVANAGDPLASLRGPDISQQTIDRRSADLGLDRPVAVRYVRWLGAAARGDFGRRAVEETSVRTLLWARLQVTLRMVTAALLVGVIASVMVGTLGASRPYSLLDNVVAGIGMVLLSLPIFWLAMVLKEFLAIRLNALVGREILSTLGAADPRVTGGLLARGADYLRHLVLPTVTLSSVLVASWSRYLRASMIEELSRDYVRAARAKGLSPSRVLVRHALPNSLVPFSSVAAVDFAQVLGGAVIVERVFNWQGMGQMLLDGVNDADTNVVLAWLVVAAALVLLLNLVADVVAAQVDPRVRLE